MHLDCPTVFNAVSSSLPMLNDEADEDAEHELDESYQPPPHPDSPMSVLTPLTEMSDTSDISKQAKKFGCTSCPKSFSRPSDLTRHLRIHLNQRPFRCKICSKGFIQASALTVHLRTHTGEKPFSCDHIRCNRSFSDSSSLARHIRSHSGEKPYACDWPDCHHAYARKFTLVKHQMREHDFEPVKADGTSYRGLHAASKTKSKSKTTKKLARPPISNRDDNPAKIESPPVLSPDRISPYHLPSNNAPYEYSNRHEYPSYPFQVFTPGSKFSPWHGGPEPLFTSAAQQGHCSISAETSEGEIYMRRVQDTSKIQQEGVEPFKRAEKDPTLQEEPDSGLGQAFNDDEEILAEEEEEDRNGPPFRPSPSVEVENTYDKKGRNPKRKRLPSIGLTLPAGPPRPAFRPTPLIYIPIHSCTTSRSDPFISSRQSSLASATSYSPITPFGFSPYQNQQQPFQNEQQQYQQHSLWPAYQGLYHAYAQQTASTQFKPNFTGKQFKETQSAYGSSMMSYSSAFPTITKRSSYAEECYTYPSILYYANNMVPAVLQQGQTLSDPSHSLYHSAYHHPTHPTTRNHSNLSEHAVNNAF